MFAMVKNLIFFFVYDSLSLVYTPCLTPKKYTYEITCDVCLRSKARDISSSQSNQWELDVGQRWSGLAWLVALTMVFLVGKVMGSFLGEMMVSLTFYSFDQEDEWKQYRIELGGKKWCEVNKDKSRERL